MKFSLETDDVQAIAAAVAEQVMPQITELLATISTQAPGKILWTEREAAELLGISQYTLKRYRLGGFVAASTSGRRILYDAEALAAAKSYLQDRFSSR